MNTAPSQIQATKQRHQLSFKKRILFALITIVGLPLLLAACGELGGRLYLYHYYGKPGKSYGIYMADMELGATHCPNSYNTNAVINNWGLRNSENTSEDKPQGVTRIYCSGGSTTFCYNLNQEDTWP